MADIDALRNRIRSNVKSNDNQEITGPVMQETLLDMTRELDPSLEEQRAKDAEAALNRGLIRVNEEVDKKPDAIDIIDYLNVGSILPDSAYYVHAGRPVLATSGEYYNTRWIGFCMSHFNNLHHSIALYTRDENDRYVFYSQFRADEADTPLEKHVALVFGGLLATPTTPGLMSAADKNMFDDMVTEVFPLTVAIASSNAGTREIGTSVTPNIVLGITRKGADVSSSANTISSQGEVQSDNKTIIGSALTSGTTTFQISVSQGGQTKSAPNQVFDFMNYRYYGVINSSTEPTKAQVKTLCENGTLTKQLSRSTKMGATDLAANKCYVFVVPNTDVNLIVKNAKSGNPISGCTVDTVTVNRVNGTAEVSCKYVIVPAGSAAWTFEITN